jgi:hypothetical protein
MPNHQPGKRLYIIAEYCGHSFLFRGWHLYLRDNKNRQQRNADGEWGWIRGLNRYRFGDAESVTKVLNELGITIRGDGSCDDDGVAEIARRFPIPRQRIWKKPRGCIEVIVTDQWGNLRLADELVAKAS